MNQAQQEVNTEMNEIIAGVLDNVNCSASMNQAKQLFTLMSS